MATAAQASAPTAAQQEYADRQAAGAAKMKARRLFGPKLAGVVTEAIEDGARFPHLVNRSEWIALVREIEKMPEAAR